MKNETNGQNLDDLSSLKRSLKIENKKNKGGEIN
jgi:hypothetical protein